MKPNRLSQLAQSMKAATYVKLGIGLMAFGMLLAILTAGTNLMPILDFSLMIVGGLLLMFSVIVERFEEWDAAHASVDAEH